MNTESSCIQNQQNININIYKCMARQVKNKELQCRSYKK